MSITVLEINRSRRTPSSDPSKSLSAKIDDAYWKNLRRSLGFSY
jgi:hypothetical protein